MKHGEWMMVDGGKDFAGAAKLCREFRKAPQSFAAPILSVE
jgi:hypothetical protein